MEAGAFAARGGGGMRDSGPARAPNWAEVHGWHNKYHLFATILNEGVGQKPSTDKRFFVLILADKTWGARRQNGHPHFQAQKKCLTLERLAKEVSQWNLNSGNAAAFQRLVQSKDAHFLVAPSLGPPIDLDPPL